MPTRDDVYRKYGEVAEAATLLETELGTQLLLTRVVDAGILLVPNPSLATSILETIDRHTLGQLLKTLKSLHPSLDEIESLLSSALRERNRLFHSFYREHNFSIFSDDGRGIMMADMQSIHNTLLVAYKTVMLVFSGIDLDALANSGESPNSQHH